MVDIEGFETTVGQDRRLTTKGGPEDKKNGLALLLEQQTEYATRMAGAEDYPQENFKELYQKTYTEAERSFRETHRKEFKMYENM